MTLLITLSWRFLIILASGAWGAAAWMESRKRVLLRFLDQEKEKT